jgi:hypothetical protein
MPIRRPWGVLLEAADEWSQPGSLDTVALGRGSEPTVRRRRDDEPDLRCGTARTYAEVREAGLAVRDYRAQLVFERAEIETNESSPDPERPKRPAASLSSKR